MKEPNPPKYVRVGPTAIFYRSHSDDYYRPAGVWSIEYTYRDGKFYADSDSWPTKRLHNTELIPISREEFLEDNAGYVDPKDYD